MSLYVGSQEAARRLGVSRATLYAYVSRGMIERRVAVDGRTSLYSLDDIAGLAARSASRARRSQPRPSIDVQITSSITRLDEHSLTYRGHDVAELARATSYEQVAELIWTGELPAERPQWPRPAAADVRTVEAITAALGDDVSDLARLLAVAAAFSGLHPGDDQPTAARRLAASVPLISGRGEGGSLAERLAGAWHQHPTPELIAAIDHALVLLADHELATSTLAVRVATSVRPDAYAALAAGLATVSGRLHGSAAESAYHFLDEARSRGAGPTLADRRAAGERIPGFGHTVYRSGDPRVEPLLEAVRRLPDPTNALATVDAVLAEAGRVIVHRANVDFALAALALVGGLAPTVPLFAVARLAGWAAHGVEEQAERPVRFRGLAR